MGATPAQPRLARPRQSDFFRRLVVQKHQVLFDGLAANVQLVARKLWVRITDRQSAQNQKFCRDSELCADDLGCARKGSSPRRPSIPCARSTVWRGVLETTP